MIKEFKVQPPDDDPPKGFSPAALIKKAVSYLYADSQLTNFVEERYEGLKAAEFCVALKKTMHLHCDWSVIDRSLMYHIFKEPITKQLLIRVLRFLEANREQLEMGYAVPNWKGKPPIWCYCHVLSVEPREIKTLLLLDWHMKVLNGILSGDTIAVTMPAGYSRYTLKEIGYPKYREVSGLELTGTRMWLQLGVNDHNRIVPLKIKATGGQKTFNAELFKKRYDHNCGRMCACSDCPTGTDKCALACRLTTKEK